MGTFTQLPVEALTATTGTFSGNVTVGGTLGVTGAITGASIGVTGNISAANYNTNGLLAAQLATTVNPGKPTSDRHYDDMAWVTNYAYYPGVSSTGSLTQTSATPPTGAGSGAVQLSTTSGATNGFVMIHGYQAFLGRYTAFRGRIGFWLPTLSDGTDTYTVYLGSWATVGLSPSRQCIYLKYSSAISANWQVVTNNGGTTTTTSAAVAANTFYIFDYTVTVTAPDAGTNPVSWAIYAGGSNTAVATGTGVVTAATSTAASQEAGKLAACITKSVGTNPRTLLVDFWEFTGTYS